MRTSDLYSEKKNKKTEKQKKIQKKQNSEE